MARGIHTLRYISTNNCEEKAETMDLESLKNLSLSFPLFCFFFTFCGNVKMQPIFLAQADTRHLLLLPLLLLIGST